MDPLSSSEVSRLKSQTRALIRIANEFERALPSASEIHERSGSANGEFQRNLTVAEHQLASSISNSTSRGTSVGVIEQDVIRPTLQSAVIVSEMAHEAVERAVRAAARIVRL